MFAQPALFVAGLAAVEKLRAEDASAADSAAVGSHGMLSVVGLGDAELDKLCTAAAAKAGDGCA